MMVDHTPEPLLPVADNVANSLYSSIVACATALSDQNICWMVSDDRLVMFVTHTIASNRPLLQVLQAEVVDGRVVFNNLRTAQRVRDEIALLDEQFMDKTAATLRRWLAAC
jgi:hypothetical protein